MVHIFVSTLQNKSEFCRPRAVATRGHACRYATDNDGYLDVDGAPGVYAFLRLAVVHGELLPLPLLDAVFKWIMRMRRQGHIMETFVLQLLARGIELCEALVRSTCGRARPHMS